MQGRPVAIGTVRFFDETNRWLLGVAPASAPTISLPTLTPGLRTIRADYSGVVGHGAVVTRPSSSAALSHRVLISPEIELSVVRDAGSHSPVTTIEARVRAPFTVPAGLVTFRRGPQTLATRILDREGRVSVVTSALDDGAHTISADYAGEGDVASATASIRILHRDRADQQAAR
jgi:hypothetical protein